MSTGQKTITPCQQPAIARLFSATVIRELATQGRSASFSKLLIESKLTHALELNDSIGAAFDKAFSYLQKKSFRTEYTYKSAIANKLLLGRHSLNTATLLTEFRVENSKVDIAIFNGTSTAYEIKSERDSLKRLSDQLSAYKKLFSKTYVITGSNHLDEVLQIANPDTGVLLLSDRHSISTIREANECADQTCPRTICDSLQTQERLQLLSALGIPAPRVPNTEMYSALQHIFSTLDPIDVHENMVQVLKRTRQAKTLANFIPNVPRSLTAAVLSTPIKEKDRPIFMGALNTSIKEALSWA